MLSVLLNSELTGRLGFLATCPKAIMVFVCGHEEGHKSRGSESSPCSLGCWGTKPSPSPCSSSLSDHRFWKKSQDPTGIMVPTKPHPSCDSTQSNAAVASFPVTVEGPRWPREMPGTRNTGTMSFAQCGGMWTFETYPSWMTPNSLRTLMKNIKFLHVVSRLFMANTANYQRLGSSLGFLVSYGSNPRRPFSCLLQVFLHDVPDS